MFLSEAWNLSPLLWQSVAESDLIQLWYHRTRGCKEFFSRVVPFWHLYHPQSLTWNGYIYIYIWCSVAHPPPPVDGSWSPPPLWLWGCGGALLVSDAADFLWFLVPPPPPVDVWMGHGGGGGAGSMYINIYVYMNISICICI